MEHLYLAFSVIFPLFCMMALGYFLRLVGIFNERFLKELNHLCFQVFLPIILFVNIYSSDFKSVFNGSLILYAVLSVVLAFGLLMIVVPLVVKDRNNCGVIIQGIYRSNYILFGIPMSASLYGDQNVSTTAVLVAFVIPIFNVLSVVALSYYASKKIALKSVLKDIAKNPLILASLLAFAVILTGIQLPQVVERTITDMGKVATPLALIALGGGFYFKNLKGSGGLLTCTIFCKLVVMPLIFVGLAILLGFRGMELAALFALFASPTAVSSYTMAQSMNANHELAGQIVVLDSIFSIVTIFIGITVLMQFGLL